MPANAPMIAALAIHKTISSYSGNLDAKVKWINDVFVSGKKISGVLVTCQNGQEKEQSYFKLNVGIGVNLNSVPFEGSICLKDVIGKIIDVDEFVDLLCANVAEKFFELDRDGFTGEFNPTKNTLHS